jgi:DNA segregation ATPase FtsK/SpoIIIE, S-DNA-T family
MPGIENTDDRDLTTAWLLHSQSSDVDQPDHRPVLTVPLGLRSDGTPLWLDLSEEAEAGSGPRGVFIGITGSDKSIALLSLVFATCARHSPQALQLVLVRQGVSFVLSDFAEYPHALSSCQSSNYLAPSRLPRLLIGLLGAARPGGRSGTLWFSDVFGG